MDSSNEAISITADQAIGILTTYGLNVIGAIVVLCIGLFIAGRAKAFTVRALERVGKFEQILISFLGSMVKYGIWLITAIAVLDRFGIETTSLVAVLGAAGLAIGLALQGTLSNIAAGVMLAVFRPFRVDDVVEVAGYSGTVKELSLFSTELATPDNVQVIIPNGDVWGSALKNFSRHPIRRLDLTVGVGYGDDLSKASDVLAQVVAEDQRTLEEPESLIAVSELADSSVNFTVRVWCRAEDFWSLKFALTRAIKERLDEEGLSIPFPQRDIHIIEQQRA